MAAAVKDAWGVLRGERAPKIHGLQQGQEGQRCRDGGGAVRAEVVVTAQGDTKRGLREGEKGEEKESEIAIEYS